MKTRLLLLLALGFMTACGNQSGAQNGAGQNADGKRENKPAQAPPKAKDDKPKISENDRLPGQVQGNWKLARLYFSHPGGQQKLDKRMVDAYKQSQEQNTYRFSGDGQFKMNLGGKTQMKGKWEREDDSLLVLTEIQVKATGQPWPGQPNSKPDTLMLQPAPKGMLRYSSRKKNVVFELERKSQQ